MKQAEVDLEPYLKKNELTATVSSSSISIKKGSEKLAGVAFNASDFQGVNESGSLSVSLKDILEAVVPSGMYKLAIDKKGRVTGYTTIQLSDLTALGVAKQADLDTLRSDLGTEQYERARAIGELNQVIQTLNNAIDDKKADKSALDTTNANVDKKVNKSDIVQVTGTSETSVMSQKAVTNSVNAEKTAREAADTALGERTTALETKLANYQVITDEEVTTMAEKVFGITQP